MRRRRCSFHQAASARRRHRRGRGGARHPRWKPRRPCRAARTRSPRQARRRSSRAARWRPGTFPRARRHATSGSPVGSRRSPADGRPTWGVEDRLAIGREASGDDGATVDGEPRVGHTWRIGQMRVADDQERDGRLAASGAGSSFRIAPSTNRSDRPAAACPQRGEELLGTERRACGQHRLSPDFRVRSGTRPR